MLNKFHHFLFNRFRNNEIKLHELSYLFWECTLKCNLNCLHCGSDCTANSRFKDIPFEDFLSAIIPLSNIYHRNSITVVITGGEPLLRQDLPEYGKELRKHFFKWGIVTNGYMYDAEIHAKLLSAGMGSITLSLDGLEENHNWLRNNVNSFSRAMDALKLIVFSNRLCYDIVTCVNKRNIKELENIKELLIENKVKNWRLFTIAPIGRAANNLEMQLSNEELIFLMNFIVETRKEGRINIYFSCESYVGKYEGKVRDSYFFCRAGVNIASVLIDGSISACPNINRKFVQGNIYNNDFYDVWNNKFELMRNRKWAKKGICKECKEFKNCNGGAMHLWDAELKSNQACIFRGINKYNF